MRPTTTDQRVDVHRPLLAALLWAPLALLLALATPWLGLQYLWVQWLWNATLLLPTVVIIGWNLVAAVRVFSATGQPLQAWPFTVAQIVLFTVLFFQIACHLGAEHYFWEQPPHWWDWPIFAAVHALRASDLFDFLEAYDIDLQVINHDSTFTASCLLVYHLILNLFVIAILFQGLGLLTKRWLAEGGGALAGSARRETQARQEQRRIFWLRVALAFGAVWLVSAVLIRPWRWQDLLLWPVESLLRVVDVGDWMQLYHVRISQVPKHVWESTLTFACRLLLGLLVGRLLALVLYMISLYYLGGYGLSRDILEQLDRDLPESSDVKPTLRERLKAMRHTSVTRSGDVRGWLVATVAVLVCFIPITWSTTWPAWDDAAHHLAKAVEQPHHPQRENALLALRRMGPFAEAAAPSLGRALRVELEQQPTLVETLAYLGQGGQAVLADCLQDGELRLALLCLPPLQERGPRSAPVLAHGLSSFEEEVRTKAEAAVLELGLPAVLPLIKTMKNENVANHGILIAQLDPQYWDRHGWPNPVYKQMAQGRAWWAVLKNQAAGQKQVLDAIQQLDALGPSALCVLPTLLDRLADENPQIQGAATGAFKRFGPTATAWAVPRLVQQLTDRDPRRCQAALSALDKLDSPWRQPPMVEKVAASLVRRLEDADERVRRSTVAALGAVGPGAGPQAIPALVERLVDLDRGVRTGSALALKRIDPDWPRSAAARTLVPNVILLLGNRDVRLRWAAAEALAAIGPEAAPQAVPALLRLLEADNRDVLLAVVEALGRMGPQAAKAIPRLEQLLRSVDYEGVAQKALLQIQGP